MPRVNEVPPQNNPESPVVSQMPEVNQGIPRNPGVPLEPVGTYGSGRLAGSRNRKRSFVLLLHLRRMPDIGG
ncbi:hypothetical protein TIFTF001_014321 [Ficus carica]|uniref:Uncharacterized protein n=1 Tax=Ficus carica TaxID=3494 RepID=A0AA88A3Q1_FICCA|nr:hypothetical protein TIFTF001_014321 [Ficus carica]